SGSRSPQVMPQGAPQFRGVRLAVEMPNDGGVPQLYKILLHPLLSLQPARKKSGSGEGKAERK
ncbi:MAG: hypothetical protein O7A06_03060, partial [Acidobacteria bacterium]|nr:hypothetical protein [Acidobacteriota bacterium]